MSASPHLDARHVPAQPSSLHFVSRHVGSSAYDHHPLNSVHLPEPSQQNINYSPVSGSDIPMAALRGTPETTAGMQPGYAHKDLDESTDGRPPSRSTPLASSMQHTGKAGSESTPKPVLGHKRTATGIVKTPTDASLANGGDRRRSKSIGSVSRGSRIAALSVHLRTRLSYAASRIEKSRQSQSPQQQQLPWELLNYDAPLPDAPARAHDGSPDGTTMSASDVPVLNPLSTPVRLSPMARSDGGSQPSSQLDPFKPRISSTPEATPRLAPPADIVPSRDDRRRRPNPNEPLKDQLYPSSLHRRYHSQHDLDTSKPTSTSETVLVPGTPPPLRPTYPTSTPYNGISSQEMPPQSTAMEQDAIETLLFMSSPGHSGYHSNSQQSSSQQQQQNQVSSSMPASQDASSNNAPWSQNSQVDGEHGRSTPADSAHPRGLESQAGDEIDRMLDQMDSDSEDEGNRLSHQAYIKKTPAGTGNGMVAISRRPA